MTMPDELKKQVEDAEREMKCDWCNEIRSCKQLDHTHYWVCLDCATKGFFFTGKIK